ncbi:MAG: serine/threonine-protein phosphatase, partial [bacterium]|nr:serine/threonine-protein phosphatase [bacterium]
RAYLRAFAKVESDPGILLTWLNNELVADLDLVHYVTLVLARLNPGENTLDYASAGHLPTYLLDRQGDVRHVLDSTGIPLGLMRDYQYSNGNSVKLEAGDILFFLTDGISEAQAPDETEFGFDPALEIVKRFRKQPAKKIMEQLYQAVRSFSQNKPQEDDITAIICKVDSAKQSTNLDQ